MEYCLNIPDALLSVGKHPTNGRGIIFFFIFIILITITLAMHWNSSFDLFLTPLSMGSQWSLRPAGGSSVSLVSSFSSSAPVQALVHKFFFFFFPTADSLVTDQYRVPHVSKILIPLEHQPGHLSCLTSKVYL